jgi:hypothetical protein
MAWLPMPQCPMFGAGKSLSLDETIASIVKR